MLLVRSGKTKSKLWFNGWNKLDKVKKLATKEGKSVYGIK